MPSLSVHRFNRLRPRPAVLPLLALMLCAAAPAAPPGATLVLDVGNVRNGAGRVHVDLCVEREFLKDGCPLTIEVPAKAGVTMLTMRGIPPGRYAVQLFHDENGNGKVDRGLFGIPKEGVGFSNDAPIRLGPPKFADAAIAIVPGSQRIAIRMRYFSGPSGPPGAR